MIQIYILIACLFSFSIVNGNTYDEDYSMKECAYSLASYCQGTKILNWNCIVCKLHIPKPAQITLFFNRTGANSGFIGYDEKTKTIKIAFQGTLAWNIQEWMDDLDIFKTEYPNCPNCFVHRGFYLSYLDLQNQVIQGLERLRKNYPNASISVTGHSLGAALAVLCAADLVVNQKIKITSLYNFGQPRVGDDNFAAWLVKIIPVTVFRVTHGSDPVPHIPLQQWGYKQSTQEVFYDKNSPYKICDENNGEDPTCSDKYPIKDYNPNDHNSYFGFNFLLDQLECQ